MFITGTADEIFDRDVDVPFVLDDALLGRGLQIQQRAGRTVYVSVAPLETTEAELRNVRLPRSFRATAAGDNGSFHAHEWWDGAIVACAFSAARAAEKLTAALAKMPRRQDPAVTKFNLRRMVRPGD